MPILLAMCAGIGAPGTLREILRGYFGDKKAPERFRDDDVVNAGFITIVSRTCVSHFAQQASSATTLMLLSGSWSRSHIHWSTKIQSMVFR